MGAVWGEAEGPAAQEDSPRTLEAVFQNLFISRITEAYLPKLFGNGPL